MFGRSFVWWALLMAFLAFESWLFVSALSADPQAGKFAIFTILITSAVAVNYLVKKGEDT